MADTRHQGWRSFAALRSRLLGTVLALAWPACVVAEDRPLINPDLVNSLVDAPEGLMTKHPYLAHFRKGELNLYFVSGHHERGKNSETCSLIRRALKKYRIGRVIVEGRPYAMGDVSLKSVERIRKESSGDTFQWGETDCAIVTAWRKGVRSIGGEPTAKDQLDAALKAGFNIRDFLADGFVKMIPAYRSQGRIAREPIDRLYDETLDWNRHELSLAADLKFDYQDFRAWYRDAMQEDFDPAKIDYEALKPIPDGTKLQRLEEAISIQRNRFLSGVISRELLKYKEVLVVYGNGHHAAMRRAIVAAMGAPVYQGP